LNRTFDVNLAEIAMQEKTGLLAYAPLGAGSLTGKYLNGQVPKGSRWGYRSARVAL
jgi:aryl-alcohol dehydrogenase-like predicted oxidoreductase